MQSAFCSSTDTYVARHIVYNIMDLIEDGKLRVPQKHHMNLS